MARRSPILVVLVATGCISEVECQRRIDAAARDGARDAEVCRWEPEALIEPQCTTVDRRPLQTYTGVFCSTAALGSCIEGSRAITLACFGGPDDTAVQGVQP